MEIKLNRRSLLKLGAATVAVTQFARPVFAQTAAESPKMIKLAAVQAAPVYMDLEASVEKAIGLIKDAAAEGVTLIAFPELWLPGYPFGHESQEWKDQRLATYVENSLTVGSPAWARLLDAAKANDIYVALGYSEREGDYLYIGQAIIDNLGSPILVRRKIRPSGGERTVWSDDPIENNIAVIDTPLGRLSALSCWENMQPLMTLPILSQYPDIHVASWPALNSGETPGWASIPVNQAGAQHFATISGAVTIMPTTVVDDRTYADYQAFEASKWVGKGAGVSAIFGADGRRLTAPMEQNTEGFVTAEVDPATFKGIAGNPEGWFSWGVLNTVTNAYKGERIADQEHEKVHKVPIKG
jgi:nitrilase